jgi:D-alanyl-D-alanine carboxypeptidase
MCFLLKAAANDETHFKPFLNSLPRLTVEQPRYGNWGKTFRGNLWLKTDYMEGVYSMAGYLRTRGDRLLCYAFIINHTSLKPPDIRKAVFQYLAGIMLTD